MNVSQSQLPRRSLAVPYATRSVNPFTALCGTSTSSGVDSQSTLDFCIGPDYCISPLPLLSLSSPSPRPLLSSPPPLPLLSPSSPPLLCPSSLYPPSPSPHSPSPLLALSSPLPLPSLSSCSQLFGEPDADNNVSPETEEGVLSPHLLPII